MFDAVQRYRTLAIRLAAVRAAHDDSVSIIGQ